MDKKSKEKKPIRSVEKLHHFSCPACRKWWTVADAPASKKKWFCPWCGTQTVFSSGKAA